MESIKKKRKLLLNSIFFFSLNAFSNPPSSIGLTFLNPKPSNATFLTFSDPRSKTAGKMHKLRNRTGLILKYQYFAQRIESVCTRIKNENSDYLIVLKIDCWKTKHFRLYSFSEHRFAQTFQLHLSSLKFFFCNFSA